MRTLLFAINIYFFSDSGFHQSKNYCRLGRTVEGDRRHRLWLKSIFKSAESSAARRGRLEIGLSRTWVETPQGALYSQVLQSRGTAEADKNLTAKCNERSFNPMATRRLPSTPSRACAARCSWQSPNWHWGWACEDALPPQCDLTLLRWALDSHCQTNILK